VKLDEGETDQLKIIADVRPADNKDCTVVSEIQDGQIFVLARNNYWPATNCTIHLQILAPKDRWNQVHILAERKPQHSLKASPKNR